VYAFVVIPVSICRFGVAGGWNPPFWLLTLAGICFSSSGTTPSLLIASDDSLSSCTGLTNCILFIFTRHALIQRAAHPPQIRITTHQLTVTDMPLPTPGKVAEDGSEEFDLKTTQVGTSPESRSSQLPHPRIQYTVQFDEDNLNTDRKSPDPSMHYSM
jgi:hypothetical protein